ncbi:MAG: BrnT family toxin [Rhodospirillaceae bacterium]|nr:BrnT family toxin [Rhodospirillaceae bacterium]
MIATGFASGCHITVIYTWRGQARRIITARAARRSERQDYERARRAHHAGQAD